MKKVLGVFMFACLSSVALAKEAPAAADAARADRWLGLSDESHHSGPKLTEADLCGKVVMGACWGANHPPSRVLLPRMEQIWQSLKHKPFVFVGSSRQGCADIIGRLVKKHNLTFPIYERFGLPQYGRIGIAQGDPRLPHMPYFFVVNRSGRVVYSGNDMSAATEAAVNALAGAGGGAVSLTGNVKLKAYKSMERQLVFGRKIKDIVARLEADAKKGGEKSAKAAMKARAQEASSILAAINMAKTVARAEINLAKRNDPAKALKLIKDFSVTFPEAAAEYKADIPVLTAEAKRKAKAGR